MQAPEPSNSSEPQRRLAAILAADIAGYSALMGADEQATIRELRSHQAVVLPMVNGFGGKIIDTAGDGILPNSAAFGTRFIVLNKFKKAWRRVRKVLRRIARCFSVSASIKAIFSPTALEYMA